MTTYSFETITAEQALNISSSDVVVISSMPMTAVTVIYDTNDTNVMVGTDAHSVVFGPAIEVLSIDNGFRGADGSKLFIGDAAPNIFTAGLTNDALFGGSGDDNLDAGNGNNLMQGNAGVDVLKGGIGSDTIYGGQDRDLIDTSEGTNFAQGNKGDDQITGGSSNDTLLGGQGDDVIFSNRGIDFLNGNLGDDQVSGQGHLMGEDGNDLLDGLGGTDTLSGGEGNDTISSLGGLVDGDSGDDLIILGTSRDITALGDDGNDTIDGHLITITRFTLSGGSGNDSLLGSLTPDTISGGDGDDTIDGGGDPLGKGDVLSGGPGQDLFFIRATAYDHRTGAPLDGSSIADWEVGDRLRSDFAGSGPANNMNYAETFASDFDSAQAAAKAAIAGTDPHYVSVEVGSDVVVFAFSAQGIEEAITLSGRSLSDISYGNII